MLVRVRAVYLVRYLKLKRIFTNLLKKLILHKYLQPFIRDPGTFFYFSNNWQKAKTDMFRKRSGFFFRPSNCNNMTAGIDKSPVCYIKILKTASGTQYFINTSIIVHYLNLFWESLICLTNIKYIHSSNTSTIFYKLSTGYMFRPTWAIILPYIWTGSFNYSTFWDPKLFIKILLTLRSLN